MELLSEFEEAFMTDDNFLFNFTDGGGSSTVKYGGPDSSSNDKTTTFGPGTQTYPFPVDESDLGKPRFGIWECDPIEDMEWLMDEEAFPPLESCFGVLSDDSEFMSNHLSPISVLDTVKANLDMPFNHPKGTRSNKRRRRTTGYGDLPSLWSSHTSAKIRQESILVGRRCQHCLVDKTPQWRAGPMGPKTLCNACGVRYKAGRLHPEYRPACSPTFSSLLHSNSHKKVMEMRTKKQSD
ncbi:GATA transcription factor 1-like [Dorcoceras hygrometricum]|nr:GATA transcription factor 1-like [Dorcoceras hygrometricum]